MAIAQPGDVIDSRRQGRPQQRADGRDHVPAGVAIGVVAVVIDGAVPRQRGDPRARLSDVRRRPQPERARPSSCRGASITHLDRRRQPSTPATWWSATPDGVTVIEREEGRRDAAAGRRRKSRRKRSGSPTSAARKALRPGWLDGACAQPGVIKEGETL
jgi:hypothetical protein